MADVTQETSDRSAGSWLLMGLVGACAVVVGYLALLPDPPLGVFGHDSSHAFISMILVFGVGCWLKDRVRPFRLIAMGSGVGAIVELVQYLDAQGRSPEFKDALYNVIGATIGAVLALTIVRFRPALSVPTGLTAVGITLAVALAGPVWSSGPVKRLVACQTVDADPPSDRFFRSADGGIEYRVGGADRNMIVGKRRVTDLDTRQLIDTARCKESFRAEVTVRSFNAIQAGPRRMLSLSRGTGPTDQNFMIGQSAADLSVRIKFRRDTFEEFTVPAVFSQNLRQKIAVEYRDGRIRIEVNGVVRFNERPRGATLANWDPSFPLNIGDEFTDDRTFEGIVEEVRIEV